MAINWLNNIMRQEEICTEGTQASFQGFINGMGDLVIITADNVGIIGNVLLEATGGTIGDFITFWNNENPQNTISLLQGDINAIFQNNIELQGGTEPICSTPDFFNTKEDQEVLQGLFCGRNAHEQKHDIHTIKQQKFWNNL